MLSQILILGYSRVWIKETNNTSGQAYKILQVDTAIESYINSETGEMAAEYLYYYDLLNYYNKNASSTLMIGGAAYTYPTYYLNKYEDKTIDVVEIDEQMTEIAKKYFGLEDNERLGIYHQDGRNFINLSENKYDAILVDAFKGSTIPFQLTTKEAVINMKNMLNDNGIVMANIVTSLKGEDSKFFNMEYETFKAVFEEVKVFAVADPNNIEGIQNIILVGLKSGINENLLNEKEEYQRYLINEVENILASSKILTDDYAPVEI